MHACMHAFIHSFIHSLIHSFTHSLNIFFFRELENRQNVEVEKRQQQTENKSLRNNLQQLESDVRDLKRALAEEQDAHAVQNQLLKDEKRKSEALVEESRQHSIQKSEALYQLEAVDQTRKSYEASSGSLREELKAAQVRVLKIRFFIFLILEARTYFE